jgi:hypothetical protein
MDLTKFHRMRQALQENATPGPQRDLVTLEGSLRYQLLTSGLFDEVEVDHTDDPDRLLIGLCQFKPEVPAEEVARRIEEIWVDRLSYPFWESHAIEAEPDHIELEAASRPSPVDGYVTLHLVAQTALIPAQRTAHEGAPDRETSLS